MVAGTLVFRGNWEFGWGFLLLGFLSGAVIGLRFHREEFLGGYTALRRRMVRLGHICFVALGILNVVFALSPVTDSRAGRVASVGFIVGATGLTTLRFLTAWREGFSRPFFTPGGALVHGVRRHLLSGG